jgi:uncharacterized protein YkwD
MAIHAALAAALAVTLLASAPRPAAAATASDVRAMLMGWLNADRVANGLVAYREWGAVDALATERAGRVAAAGVLSHDVAGGDVGNALDASGIPWSWYGEALGLSRATWGEEAARQVYDLWMASPPHHDILMSAVDNYVGIGIVEATDGSTWISLIATQSPDHTPPVAANVSLRRSGTTLTFTWRGSDPRLQTLTAGIRSYDVQVRRDNAAWWTLRNDTTATSATMANRPHGHWFSFRVQAADRRGTLSPWTSAIRIWVP